MRQFSLGVFIGSTSQAQILTELECYFVDHVVIDDKYSLGCPSSFTSSSLVFLLCSLFPHSSLFTVF